MLLYIWLFKTPYNKTVVDWVVVKECIPMYQEPVKGKVVSVNWFLTSQYVKTCIHWTKYPKSCYFTKKLSGVCMCVAVNLVKHDWTDWVDYLLRFNMASLIVTSLSSLLNSSILLIHYMRIAVNLLNNLMTFQKAHLILKMVW